MLKKNVKGMQQNIKREFWLTASEIPIHFVLFQNVQKKSINVRFRTSLVSVFLNLVSTQT